MADIFFDSEQLPNPKWEYVAFVDIMGTKSHMKKSVSTTANYIFKLHAAILSAWRNEKYQNVFVYPVMDGAYITAANRDDIEKIIVRIYLELSKILTREKNQDHIFIIRSAIAYGESIHGHHVPFDASKVFETDLSYKNYILLGSTMINACQGESEATPFGVYIDSSAMKDKKSNKKHGSFPKGWKWFNSQLLKIDPGLIEQLKETVVNYFEKLKKEGQLDSPKDYVSMVENYFA